MGHKGLAKSSSLPLNVFRSQIMQFKQSGAIPRYDGLFEKDAILAALRRIDPTLSPADANMHADIIRNDPRSSFRVADGDIQYAQQRMVARLASVTYPMRYALTSLRMNVYKAVKNYVGKFEKVVSQKHLGGALQLILRDRSSYTTLIRHV